MVIIETDNQKRFFRLYELVTKKCQSTHLLPSGCVFNLQVVNVNDYLE